jgi:hypothetical protein
VSTRSLRTSSRHTEVDLPAAAAWAVVASGAIGPQWYVDAAPLVLRGAVDRLVGGEGRRWTAPGRPLLRAGDTVGFWRVTEAGRRGRRHRLLLEAAVRSPGRVLLRTEVEPLGQTTGEARCRVHQTVSFDPDGVLGHVYRLVDLPAREAVLAMTHRRLLADLGRSGS